MLTSLPNLKTINLSRNELTNFPAGGPQQFASAVVRHLFLFAFFRDEGEGWKRER